MMSEQVGAIPFRVIDGDVEFLIITTRTSGRWICPKGNVEVEHGQIGSAHLEAFEEAGVEGDVLRPNLGTYEHGDTLTPVRMWLLRVEQVHDTWPEDDERMRRWLEAPEAQATVDEPGLRRLMEAALDRLRAA